MPSLSDAQRNFIATLNEGPDTLDPALFTGNPERILLGLKAHANTISHARLIAMEESFPLTRAEMGNEQFNALCRDYVETAEAKACDIAVIGRHFPAFLETIGTDLALCDLAAIEWAWLQSYHAPDRNALNLARISTVSEPDLTGMEVLLHPAVRVHSLRAHLAAPLAHLGDAQIAPSTMLVTRPEAEVRLLAIDLRTSQLLEKCLQPISIGNLLALASEQGDETDPIGPVLTLIGAGALVEME